MPTRVASGSLAAETADALVAELSSIGPVVSIPADLSTEAECIRLAAAVGEREAHVDVLVDNAGAAWGAPLAEFPEAGWDKVLALNLKSPFSTTRAADRLCALLTRPRIIACVVAATAALALSACGSPRNTAAESSSTTASASACTPARLATHARGVLTVATDAPAYPPYFEHDDPTNGRGFESAVAYAIAGKLGYARARVKWVTEPFDSSYAPGPKSFDFDINEISITPARSKVVAFSTPYYTNPQGILVDSGSALAHATSLAAFKNAKIGVQIGTTSLDAVGQTIKPSQQPQVFNTSNDVVSAFKIGRVNAIVVDLATAFELTSEIKGSAIAGQFSAPGGDRWGVLLSKGSTLTPCVDRAIETLRSDGTLASLDKRWIASAAKAPDLH